MISAGEVHLPGPTEGHRRAQGARDRRAAGVRQRAPGGREGPGRRPDPRAGPRGGGLRGARRRRRRRSSARSGLGLREDRRRGRADARLGPRARLRLDVPHRRPVDRRLERDPRGRRPRGAARHRRPRQRRHDGAARRATSRRWSRPGWRSRSSTAATCARRSTRSALARRERRPGPRDPRQRRARRGPASSRSGSCGRWPTSRRSAASRRRSPSPSRPATPPASTGSRRASIAVGREADLALVDAPIGLRRGHARSARSRSATCRASAWCSSTATPVIGRSRNTPPAARAARRRQGFRARRRPATSAASGGLRPMHFGLRLPSFALGDQTASLAEMGAYLRRAEDLGFDSAMLIDHLLVAPPAYRTTWLEPITLLAALVGRHPHDPASARSCSCCRSASPSSSRSSGRRSTCCRAGARSSASASAGWRREFEAVGIPHRERGARMNELLGADHRAVDAGDGHLRGPLLPRPRPPARPQARPAPAPADLDRGRDAAVREDLRPAACPRSSRSCGGSRSTRRRGCRTAPRRPRWSTATGTDLVRFMGEYGRPAGRPVEGLLELRARPQARRAPESAAPFFRTYSGMDLEYWQEFYLLGEAEQVAERIRGKIEALGGVDHVILNPLDWDPERLDVLARRRPAAGRRPRWPSASRRRTVRPATLAEALDALADGGEPRLVVCGGTDVYPAHATRPDRPAGARHLARRRAPRDRAAAGRRLAARGDDDLDRRGGGDAAAAGVRRARGPRRARSAGGRSRTPGPWPATSSTPRPRPTGRRTCSRSTRTSRSRPRRVASRIVPLARVRHRQPARRSSRPDELVTARPRPGRSTAARGRTFAKLGSRAYLVISIVSVAAVAVVRDGVVADARVVVGACSPVPRAARRRWRRRCAGVRAAEAADVGARPAHLDGLTPIDDVRGPAAYRQDAALTLVRRAVAAVTA